MKFVSTSRPGNTISFRDAVLNNLPNDGGLYFPMEIPELPSPLLHEMVGMELHEVAAKVLSNFCLADIPQADLEAITKRVFNFPIPVKSVAEGISCLELFHGPTFAFKDIGAKFLAECLSFFNISDKQKRTVLVATSGDTGGAVANGFLGVDGVDVIILYPKGKVSELQEKQLTTLGQNIKALEIDGNFDDCQYMVKQAFADDELSERMKLSSANSINIGRWLPQSLFYFQPLLSGETDITISVPSGNYGNLTSGVLAMKMGVPIKSFIAASNLNDVVPRYLDSGVYSPVPTIATVANAMDVSDPSNFKRLLTLYDDNHAGIVEDILPFSLADGGILETIAECYENHDYLLDPHSAVAYEALQKKGRGGVFLGTAHYCKFLPTIEKALNKKVELPDFVNDLMDKKKEATLMDSDFEAFKAYLMDI